MPPTMTDLAENSPLSLTRLASALTYLDAIDRVEGSLLPTTALAMIEVLWAQERLGALGDIGEIGGWRGKSFLALAAGARPGDRLVAIGPVDARPDLDATPHGTGNRSALLEELALFFPGVQLVILQASSPTLVNDTSAVGVFRFLSIDNGHAHSPDDLRLADASLTEQGVCWLDDGFNESFSVTSAYLDAAPGLQPVALFPGKLVLVRPSMAEIWRTQFRGLFARAIERQDVELHCVHIDLYKDAWSELASALRASLLRSAAERRALEAESAVSAYVGSAATAERRALVAEAALSAAETRALEAERRALVAEGALSAFQASTSWRITSPFRALATVLRG
jgi:hypothetical protein